MKISSAWLPGATVICVSRAGARADFISNLCLPGAKGDKRTGVTPT